ncbi:hypothetical protein [Azospirillum melinis]|nr:hypothetical protein [Azospirillum melinis]MBP2304837.1 hypothetical protein [Azospirillum melinis]
MDEQRHQDADLKGKNEAEHPLHQGHVGLLRSDIVIPFAEGVA